MSHARVSRKRLPPAPSGRNVLRPEAHSTGKASRTGRHGLVLRPSDHPVHRLAVQTKLTVGRADDAYEREAERVADRAVSGQPAGEVSRIPPGGLKAQRLAEDPREDAGQPAASQRHEMEAQNDRTAADTEHGAVPVQRRETEEDGVPVQHAGGYDGAVEVAQPMCAACAAMHGQRNRTDSDSASSNPAVQRQAANAPQSSDAECEGVIQSREDTAQAVADEGDEFDEAEDEADEDRDEVQDEEDDFSYGAGEELAPECGEDGENADEPEADEEAGAEPEAAEDIGCGEDAGAEEAEATAGGESCGGEAEASEEGGGADEGGGPAAEAETAPEPAAAAASGAVPGCAEPVEAAEEAPGEDEGAASAESEHGAGECAVAQRQEESGGGGEEADIQGREGPARDDGDAQPRREAAPQSRSDAENEAPDETQAQRQEADEKGAEESQAQREESGEEGPEETQAQREEGGAGETQAQRQEADEESAPETHTQRQEAEEEGADESAQTCATCAARRRKLNTAAASRLIHARGAGESLLPTVRRRLESSLDTDLSGVRVHSDGNARAASRALRAKAFTHGSHIFLGSGQSQHDVSLMAHEGTHVLQQGGVVRRKPVQEPEPASSRPSAGPAAPAKTSAPAAGRASAEAAPGRDPLRRALAEVTAAAARPGAVGDAGYGPPRAGTAASTPTPPANQTDEEPILEPGPSVAGAARAGAAAHPEAEAAAASRLEDDRRRAAEVGRRLAGEAARQKGPVASRARQRRAAAGAAESASAAAPTPENEPISRGQAGHVDRMAGARGGAVDQPRFLELVEAKLATMETPRTLEAMDQFKEEGGAANLKQEVAGGVGREVVSAQGEIRPVVEAGASPAPARVPVPLGPVVAAPGARPIGAADAAPVPMREKEVTLEPSRDRVERDLAAERLTSERLEKANDPRFTGLQQAREEVHEHADAAPAAFRAEEAGVLGSARGGLERAETAGGGRMRRAHGSARGAERSEQHTAMSREEAERRQVAAEIERRYRAVEEPVRDKLAWLAGKDGEPGEVDRQFDQGELGARQAFEDYVADSMSAWRWRRYGGRALIPLVGGAIAAGTWVYDKLKGIDEYPEIVRIFDNGRARYLAGLRQTIGGIARTVENALAWCKDRIDRGRDEIDAYVRGLDPRLVAVGRATAAAVFERFDALGEDVDAAREELAERVAERYRESREQIDARIEELQAENRGLVDRFVSRLREVVDAIRNFRSKIGPLLAEAGDVVEHVIDDPIGFLGNLLGAVKKGFNQFRERIDEHLRKGVVSWLFGTLATIGVTIPKDFTPKAIGGVVLQVLGLTFENVKRRAARVVGPRAAGVIERVTGYLGTLFRDGPAGLWEQLKEELGNLRDKVMEEVRSWVITRIVAGAVKKLVSMFNPVGAIVQAVITIYNVIMFFLENIERILEVVRSVIRAAGDIVRGQLQTAADRIETAMGAIVPLVLGFLARLINLGGLADKVRSVIGRFRRTVDRAITRFLRKVVAKFRQGVAGARRVGAAVKRFLFPKRAFRAGPQRHQLFFRGGDARATLMIASDTREARRFLAELRSRPENQSSPNRETLAEAQTQLAAIERAKKQIDANPDQARKGIEAALGIIADRLGKVLSQGEVATEANPLPLAYPKRGSQAYPQLLIGPMVGTGGPRISQKVLEGARSEEARKRIAAQIPDGARKRWKDRGLAIERFDPHGSKALPEGGPTIGITSEWRTSIGKKMRLPPKGKTPGGGKINAALAPYGYSAKAEGLDGDHVTEIQLGGKDVHGNLWPLDQSENRGAGATLRSASFVKPDGGTVKLSELKKQAGKKHIWLVITSTK
jgi:hypothetical protein